MTTNQPTDATRFKAALYAQCPEPVADDIWERFESLTAQLAAAKAEAKALEKWGEQLIDSLRPVYYATSDDKTAKALKRAISLAKHQPVDASSLARIARVALEALIPCEGGCTCSMCVLSQTLTDADRALAQALAGGA